MWHDNYGILTALARTSRHHSSFARFRNRRANRERKEAMWVPHASSRQPSFFFFIWRHLSEPESGFPQSDGCDADVIKRSNNSILMTWHYLVGRVLNTKANYLTSIRSACTRSWTILVTIHNLNYVKPLFQSYCENRTFIVCSREST